MNSPFRPPLRLVVASWVAAATTGLGAVWWWALAGMSPEVGTAAGWTAATAVAVAATLSAMRA